MSIKVVEENKFTVTLPIENEEDVCVELSRSEAETLYLELKKALNKNESPYFELVKGPYEHTKVTFTPQTFS